MNPLLKRTKSCSLVRQSAESNGLAVGENDFQTQYHVSDPAIPSHAVTDAAFINHGADHDGRSVGTEIRQHQPMFSERVMDRINAGSALGNDVLQYRIDFEDFVHPE